MEIFGLLAYTVYTTVLQAAFDTSIAGPLIAYEGKVSTRIGSFLGQETDEILDAHRKSDVLAGKQNRHVLPSSSVV